MMGAIISQQGYVMLRNAAIEGADRFAKSSRDPFDSLDPIDSTIRTGHTECSLHWQLQSLFGNLHLVQDHFRKLRIFRDQVPKTSRATIFLSKFRIILAK